jgi:octaheme c-type cytochrome (tetrathionate reductase family)
MDSTDSSGVRAGWRWCSRALLCLLAGLGPGMPASSAAAVFLAGEAGAGQAGAGQAGAGQARPGASPVQPWHAVPEVQHGGVGRRMPQDHSHFPQLKGPFTSPEQVTRACLGCHTAAAHQVMAGIHWTWKAWDPKTRQYVGKNEVYNNFCVSPVSNEQFCTVCHAGYGSTDPDKFIPFAQRTQDHVDCLVCHDQTRTYHKIPFIGGNPALSKIAVRPGCGEVYGTDKPYVLPEDLGHVARHVGPPTRYTCGQCHFYGGGGDGVKHGDLDSSMASPSREEDVHMAPKGLDFSCQQCHRTENHVISGSRYVTDVVPSHGASMRGSPHQGQAASCVSCHGWQPHEAPGLQGRIEAATLNMHTRELACETCHIPEFARGGLPTKMQWNYATAGKLAPNGSPLVINDARGWNTYWGVKGSFRWAENVVPSYRWFNGVERWMTLGSRVGDYRDARGVVQINAIEGSATDGKSRIFPFKIMRTNQPYDTSTGMLAVFHSFGFDKSAYTMGYDWQTSIAAGMKAAKLPYSGHYGFVRTEMYWPIEHMVAPAGQSLRCMQCHADHGRLQDVDGVYIPGRSSDHNAWIERIGRIAAALALAGVAVHALLRLVVWWRRRR